MSPICRVELSDSDGSDDGEAASSDGAASDVSAISARPGLRLRPGKPGASLAAQFRSEAMHWAVRVLTQTCGCHRFRIQRGNRRGDHRSSCLAQFLAPTLFNEFVDQHMSWLELHKLDQDRLLFDVLREHVALSRVGARPLRAQAVATAEEDPHTRGPSTKYSFLRRPVCKDAFKKLWAVGSRRFRSLHGAALSGAKAPPVDLRYLTKPCGRPAVIRSWVVSYLEEIYESEAETMPDMDDGELQWWEDMCDDTAFYPVTVADPSVANAGLRHELRWLPPGTIHQYWQLYNQVVPEQKATFRYFWWIWKAEFTHKLRFRCRQQHALCATCVSHKLVIRQLGDDLIKRQRQVELLDAHRQEQYKDRRVYWAVRAEALLHPLTVVIIIDGMDQAKWCFPRSPAMKSKSLEGFQRPRLHVNAAIAHGKQVLVAVSPSDFPKNANVTIEIAMMVLRRLEDQGVPLRRVKLHLQLDNTSSCNKNNHLFRWAAVLTAARLVHSIDVCFLRTGHTHEA